MINVMRSYLLPGYFYGAGYIEPGAPPYDNIWLGSGHSATNPGAG